MGISEKEIIRVMFSGMGMGIDLAKAFSNFLDNRSVHQRKKKDKEKEGLDFLQTPLPDEYQEVIRKAAKGVLMKKGRDYSFIPSKQSEIEDFANEWEGAYKGAVKSYRKLTDNVFDLLKRGAVFMTKYITNRLEYKRKIQTISNLQAKEYSDMQDYFSHSFRLFDRNAPWQENLEKMQTSMNIFYRTSKDSSCSIDAFAMRIKSMQRIAQKMARKFLVLIDKIREAERMGEEYIILYDDLVVTDPFGFSVLQRRGRDFDGGAIYSNNSIRTIEDHLKNDGQRQVKLIDTETGTLYDFHQFGTLKDLVDNEFARENIDRTKEVVPHEMYMEQKMRDVINKNPQLYKPLYGELRAKFENLLEKCYSTTPKETDHDVYMRLSITARTSFLSELRSRLSTDMRLFKNDIKRAKGREGLTIPGMQSRLTNVVRCYNEEIRKRLDYNLDDVCSQDGTPKESVKAVMDSGKRLVEQFNEISKSPYETRDLEEFQRLCLSIEGLCFLNWDADKKYNSLKSRSSNRFSDSEAIELIDYYKGKLDDFPKDFPSDNKLYIQARFNIFKCFINTYKLALHKSNDMEKSNRVYFGNLFRYNSEFSSLFGGNDKLSSSQLSEVEVITKKLHDY